MSYQEKLVNIISVKVDTCREQGRALIPQWIAQAICEDYKAGLADNDQAELWRHVGYLAIRKEVGKFITKRAGESGSSDRSPVLPGFEHLQHHYLVARQGEELEVSVGAMTKEETVQWIAMLRSRGAACYAHADELEEYMNEKRAQGA
jgi:hypothetical protein